METYTLRVWPRYRIYIQGNENIVADALSRFTINGNQETTHDYTYKK